MANEPSKNASHDEALLHNLSHVFLTLQNTFAKKQPYKLKTADGKEVVLYPDGVRYIARTTFYGKLSISVVYDVLTIVLIFEDIDKIRVAEVLNR